MKMKYIALVCATLATLPSASQAEDATSALTDSSANEFGSTMANSDLDASRGTFQPLTYNISTLTGDVSNNTCNGCSSGSNTIADGALNNVSGFATVIQNSGNHVVIQDSTTINITFADNPL